MEEDNITYDEFKEKLIELNNIINKIMRYTFDMRAIYDNIKSDYTYEQYKDITLDIMNLAILQYKLDEVQKMLNKN